MSAIVKIKPPLVERGVQRTHSQIVSRISSLRGADIFGFETADLLVYLTWDHAKPFLHAGANESEWRAKYPVFIPPLKAATDYLPYAWKMANKSHAVASLRTVCHLKAWFWLAGFGVDLMAAMNTNYNYYSKGPLIFASEALDFDWRNADDGEWYRFSSLPATEGEKLAAQLHWTEMVDYYTKKE